MTTPAKRPFGSQDDRTKPKTVQPHGNPTQRIPLNKFKPIPTFFSFDYSSCRPSIDPDCWTAWQIEAKVWLASHGGWMATNDFEGKLLMLLNRVILYHPTPSATQNQVQLFELDRSFGWTDPDINTSADMAPSGTVVFRVHMASYAIRSLSMYPTQCVLTCPPGLNSQDECTSACIGSASRPHQCDFSCSLDALKAGLRREC